jgi:hypothetical protein
MSDVSKLAIEFWDIADIKPYPKNPTKHAPEQVTRLARSIKRLGVQPLQLEPDGTIIAGHGRRLSLLELGRTKVPVIVRRDLSKAECDALRIADNAAVSNEIDYDLVSEEALRLSEDGFDLGDLGMTEEELRAMTTDIGEIDESAFSTDITAAVDTQKAENAAKEAAIDEKEGPVSEAMGFKKVTTTQSRLIRSWMAGVEASTGLTGAAALIEHIAQG